MEELKRRWEKVNALRLGFTNKDMTAYGGVADDSGGDRCGGIPISACSGGMGSRPKVCRRAQGGARAAAGGGQADVADR
jgi:hypothetical protein